MILRDSIHIESELSAGKVYTTVPQNQNLVVHASRWNEQALIEEDTLEPITITIIREDHMWSQMGPIYWNTFFEQCYPVHWKIFQKDIPFNHEDTEYYGIVAEITEGTKVP